MALGTVLLMLMAGVGMTTIIVEGEIFVPVKNLLEKFMPKFFMKMLNCHQCCGFWSGLIMSFFFMQPTDWTSLQAILDLGKNFAAGCAVSMLAVFWATIMIFIESKTTISQ